MIREEEMKRNKELFEQVRRDKHGKGRLIPWYPEAYWKAKRLLENRNKDRV